MENYIEIEKQLCKNIDLLEIAKTYCESNDENPIFTLSSLLEVIIQNEKNLIACIDK